MAATEYAGDWLLQQRVTEPAADNTTADLLNELAFMSDQRAIVAAAAPNSGAAGPTSSSPPTP